MQVQGARDVSARNPRPATGAGWLIPTDLGTFLAAGLLFAVALIFWWAPPAPATAQAPVVRAVFFFSPGCSHCQQVVREIPAVFESFGGPGQVWNQTGLPQDQAAFFGVSNGSLEFLMVNVSLTLGRNLYDQHTWSAGILENRLGVPRLVVGGRVLVGSQEILNGLPAVVEAGLAEGGVNWPGIPGLPGIVATTGMSGASAPPSAEQSPGAEEEPAVVSPVESEEPVQPPADAAADIPTTDLEPLQPADAEPRQIEAERHLSPAGKAVLEAELESIRPLVPRGSAPDAVDPPAEVVETTEPTGPATASESASLESYVETLAGSEPTMMERFARDPIGNGLSVLTLVGMLLSVVIVTGWGRPALSRLELGPLVPLLALIGAGVAGYLTYVEATGRMAVCGPVGHCNEVQQSEYARIVGLIPIGVLGLVGYVAILGAWVTASLGSRRLTLRAVLVVGAIAASGTIFSMYLTFLEPFVIGATCAWCLTSAVLITMLMVLSAPPARSAWQALRSERHRVRPVA